MTQYQTASIHRLPGRVVRPDPALPVSLEFTGPPKSIKDSITSRCREEISDLLRRAGYAGTFSIQVTTYVKGTPHNKGLRIKSPSRHGIELTWHEGSNDNCLSMFLRVPHKEDIQQFHAKLKVAQTALEPDEERKPVSTPVKIEVPVPSVPEPITTPPTSPMAVDRTSPNYRFVDDIQLVELFMGAIVKQADSRGLVSKRVCLDVIKQFGITSGGVGVTFSSLLQHGHLDARQGGAYALSSLWAEKFDLHSKAITPERVPAAGTPPVNNTVTDAYRALEEKVAGASALRANLARLRTKCAELKRLHDETVAEFRATKAELDALGEYEQKLALIRETLGLS